MSIWESCFTASKQVMIIVQALCDFVEEVLDRTRLPSVDALRPASCPLCGHLAVSPGEPLGIVGHGTYERQVLGVVEESCGRTTTLVRRYLCRGCGRTLSVLADHLHPRRWYAAAVILEALRLHLIEEVCEPEIRRRLGIEVGSESWRSLRRWRTELLWPLWGWLARSLGIGTPAATRSEGRRRLLRLFSQAVPRSSSQSAARRLGVSTVHFQGISWSLGRDPPEEIRRRFRSV